MAFVRCGAEDGSQWRYGYQASRCCLGANIWNCKNVCFDVLYYGYEIDVIYIVMYYYIYICWDIRFWLLYVYTYTAYWCTCTCKCIHVSYVFFCLKPASFCRLPISEAVYRGPTCRTILRAPPCGSPSPQADGTCIAGAECTGSSFEAWVFQHSRGIHDFSQPKHQNEGFRVQNPLRVFINDSCGWVINQEINKTTPKNALVLPAWTIFEQLTQLQPDTFVWYDKMTTSWYTAAQHLAEQLCSGCGRL